jgi:hypothetical protein
LAFIKSDELPLPSITWLKMKDASTLRRHIKKWRTATGWRNSRRLWVTGGPAGRVPSKG